MPRYFFDVHSDGHKHPDDTGTVFGSLEEVRLAAMRVLPAVAKEEIPKHGDNHQALTVLVTDEDGHPVYAATLAYVGLWLLR